MASLCRAQPRSRAPARIVICPEIHAPTPIKHRVTQATSISSSARAPRNFGLMIDTGIFQDRPLTHWGSHQINDEMREHMAFLKRHQGAARTVPRNRAVRRVHSGPNSTISTTLWKTSISRGAWSSRRSSSRATPAYLSSEYEGLRSPWRAIDQVRPPAGLLRKLEREYDLGLLA